jgi:hypothetical protein
MAVSRDFRSFDSSEDIAPAFSIERKLAMSRDLDKN